MTITTKLSEVEVRDRAARFGLNAEEVTKLNFVVGGGGSMTIIVRSENPDAATIEMFLRALVSARVAVAGA